MLTLEAEWELLSKPQWGLFCIFLKNCLLQILRTSPIKHSSLAQSYVINPNFAGSSAVVKKLITLDASSERGSDAQLSSASVAKCSLLGHGREGGHIYMVAFIFGTTACRFIPPHIWASDGTTLPAPGLENEGLSSRHTMPPNADPRQISLGRAFSNTESNIWLLHESMAQVPLQDSCVPVHGTLRQTHQWGRKSRSGL